jgi:hypothetical protein
MSHYEMIRARAALAAAREPFAKGAGGKVRRNERRAVRRAKLAFLASV